MYVDWWLETKKWINDGGYMLAGTHFVRVLRSALHACRRYWPKAKERMEVRRHALKLKFWGLRHEPTNTALDLSYESIKSMPGSGVYELRIDDEIGGQTNIRVIFLVPPPAWVPKNWTKPLPVLWLLDVLPKKSDSWKQHQIDRFWAAREVVRERFYSP